MRFFVPADPRTGVENSVFEQVFQAAVAVATAVGTIPSAAAAIVALAPVKKQRSTEDVARALASAKERADLMSQLLWFGDGRIPEDFTVEELRAILPSFMNAYVRTKRRLLSSM